MWPSGSPLSAVARRRFRMSCPQMKPSNREVRRAPRRGLRTGAGVLRPSDPGRELGADGEQQRARTTTGRDRRCHLDTVARFPRFSAEPGRSVAPGLAAEVVQELESSLGMSSVRCRKGGIRRWRRSRGRRGPCGTLRPPPASGGKIPPGRSDDAHVGPCSQLPEERRLRHRGEPVDSLEEQGPSPWCLQEGDLTRASSYRHVLAGSTRTAGGSTREERLAHAGHHG